MRCPSCNHNKTRVVDSRPRAAETEIHRRRKCDSCGRRFSTTEVLMVADTHKALLEDRIRARARVLQDGLISDLQMITDKQKQSSAQTAAGVVKQKLLARTNTA